MVHPFDLKTALLAKHAQHVVLIHFPIALFITGVAFDLILQSACGCDFNAPSSRHGHSRVAVPTRGPEAEGHPASAPGTCVRVERNDLAILVAAFPRPALGTALAELPPGT
jgi:hypothetical protein